MPLLITSPTPKGVPTKYVDAQNDYGAKGDGIADDTTALQNWINGAISTGRTGWLPYGTYNISSVLTINGRCSLEGEGIREVWGSFTGLLAWPAIAPHLEGSVIVQTAHATDAILVTTIGGSVNLKEFGVMFGTPFINTGHGINCQPPLLTVSADSGITSSVWENVVVYGHDGDHYAYRLINPQIVTRTTCRSYGGGGLYMRSETDATQNYFYGNVLDLHPYHVVLVAGAAHGFVLSSKDGLGPLDQLCFVRPQAWVMNDPVHQPAGTSPPTAAQKCFAVLDDTPNTTFAVSIVGADFENNVSSTVTLPNHEITLSGSSYIDPTTSFYQPNDGFITNAGVGQADGFYTKSNHQGEFRSYWTLVLAGHNEATAVPDLGAAPTAAGIVVLNTFATSIALATRGAASQSADIQQWQDSNGNPLAKVTSNGSVGCRTIIPGILDTMTYASTIALDVTAAEVHKTTTVNATGNATINASAVGTAGQRMTVIITNDATSGKTITFGTNFHPSATLVGTISKTASVSFISDGTGWYESGRTTGL